MEERRKGKHLTLNERLTFERLLIKNYSIKEAAEIIGCSQFTLYKERKRATYIHTNSDLTEEVRYCPEQAEKVYRDNLKKKGRTAKLKENTPLKEYIAEMIEKEKYSPEAILQSIEDRRLSFDDSVCKNTIYNSIKAGYFENITMEILPAPRRPRRKKIKVQKRAVKGTNIERRDVEVSDREIFGHWEMDTVIGKATNKKSLLVLTERKTRMEIIEELKTHTTDEVRKALNRIEKRFGSSFFAIFKTITVDNGSEFANYKDIEKSLYRIGNRTSVYYCHPHCPHERGSNEVNNKLIRRWLPKGSDFDELLNRTIIKKIETWMNQYPRKLFKGKSSENLYRNELKQLGLSFII